jgi:hypothetical protein
MIDALRAAGVTRASLLGRIATTTSPGGDQVAFRGRIEVTALLSEGERAEYVEQVMPYITSTMSPELSASADKATDLRSAQLALARQLRSYRGEYQAVVEAARQRLTERLTEAGISVVEQEE